MRAPNLGARYEYLRRLGRGGAGEVFLARDTADGRLVSLKRIDGRRLDAETVDRFRQEFRLLAAIEHPAIARARDFGFVDGRPYFTYDFIDGVSLDNASALRRRSPKLLLDVLWALAGALAFLHRHGLLHLDVKPGNIILRGDPAQPEGPVLIDFGLFRRGWVAPAGARVRGSLPYLAPEYLCGGPLGPWTDVYALGVCLYRCISGEFPGPIPRLGRAGVVAPPVFAPRPLSRRCPEAAGALEAVLLKCLAADPDVRYRSGAELLESVGELRRASSNERSPDPRGTVPLPVETVGRGAELETARKFLESAISGRGGDGVLLITGPQGSGQTRFLRELQCVSQTMGLAFDLHAFYPNEWRSPGALLERLDVFLSDDDGERAARWRGFLSESRRADNLWGSRRIEEEQRAASVSALSNLLRGIRRPCVLAADNLQFADPASLELLKDLVALIQRGDRTDPPPLHFVLGYREEGPSLAIVRDLSSLLLTASGARVVALRPLDPRECATLYRAMGGGDADGRDALRLFQETAGLPARIAAAAGKGGDDTTTRPTRGSTAEFAGRKRGAAKPVDRLRLVLALLRRPAPGHELAALAEMAPSAVSRVVSDLESHGLAASQRDPHGNVSWLAGAALSPDVLDVGAKSRPLVRAFRLKIARAARSRAAREPMALLEAMEHFEAAGDSHSTVACGMKLAHYLRATHQSRAALGVYGRVLSALPRDLTAKRVEATLAAADLHSVLGDADDGIHVLRSLLSDLPKADTSTRVRTIARLAVLLSRRGDYRRADALFAKILGRRETVALTAHEALRFSNERAAVKAILGDLEATERLCAEALAAAKGKTDARTREVVLNLHATVGSVALRRHDYPRAAREFASAASMAELLGARASQAIILNNLGTALSQSDRFQEASRTYSDAERICTALGATPSLASIRGNSAILHAKLGDFPMAAKNLQALAQMEARSIGRRGELLREHALGLCAFWMGRVSEARTHFERALPLGRSVGDLHVVRADELYRAECWIFEGRYAEADIELSRLCKEDLPPSTLASVLSRRAFLVALLGADGTDAFRAAREAMELAPDVHFLKAWDRLYLAWSLGLAGDVSGAEHLLARADSYFRSSGLKPASDLCACVRAEALLLAGRVADASSALRCADEASGLAASLHPLLAACCSLGLGPARAALTRASDLLAQSGASMAGNSLHEWSLRSRAFRDALGGASRATLDDLRRMEAGRLPAPFREAYVGARAWAGWVDVVVDVVARAEKAIGRRSKPRACVDPVARTAAFAIAGQRADAIVKRSPAMRALAASIEKVARSAAPLLILGETGAGKGLVAKRVHDESPRRFSPFRVIDCGSIPTGMFEAELFGAKAGSFTGAGVDRPGLLAAADGGTIVFEEIGSVPLELQAKLLRALGERRFRALGADEERAIDVRFLFTSSKDLTEEVEGGRFRRDLYHRINVHVLRVPPLRERIEDLPDLARGVLAECGRDRDFVSARVLRRLASYAWPGNVRELRNVIQRACLEHSDGMTVAAVERFLEPVRPRAEFPRSLLAAETLHVLQARLEREYILSHFERLGGSTELLCKHLGLSSRQLYRKCVRLGIKLRVERKRIPLDRGTR
jgi:DNA-binding NtrC family response regulator/tetratricopeptide (TPR) repeat protein